MNPDKMRMDDKAVQFVRRFVEQGKPVAAICHGPWLLIEADLVRGRTATSWPSIRTDLRNAGAKVVDEAVVTDGNIVTSRKPDDVEAFTNAVVALLEDAPEVEEIRQPSELPA
jgi:protease I